MQTEFFIGRGYIQGELTNPRSAHRREARREVARQEAVAARFADPELVAARNKIFEDDRRRVELLNKVEGLKVKVAAANAYLAKAERMKAAAEERLRSLREAERELAEMTAPPATETETVEPEPPEPIETKRGPGRPKKAAA